MNTRPFPKRLLLLTDRRGNILAACAIEDSPPARKGPVHVAFVPSEGQTVKVVDVPENFPSSELGADWVTHYRVEFEGERAKFVRQAK
jgi:hypothetical protein